MRKQSAGMTLLELMLALAIGGALFVMGVKQYEIYRRGLDQVDLMNQVDRLFYAAALYYRAECGAGGKLDPLTQSVSNIEALDINNDLIKKGYLSEPFPDKYNENVNQGGSGYNGYTVQLNKTTAERTYGVCADPPQCTTTDDVQIGTVIRWQIQVAVHMRDTSNIGMKNMKNLTAADCTSDVTGSPSKTKLCSTNPNGDYLVFVRTPRTVLNRVNAMSPYWQSMPAFELYNQEVQSIPLSQAAVPDHSPEFNYYYCSS